MSLPEPKFRQLPPLSLYIHIPWCVRKCPYCDFNSHEKRGEIPVSQYVDALKSDLAQDAAYAQGRKLRSIFIGGGTPSLFPADAIAEILRAAETNIPFEKDIEVTLEANPGTTEYNNLSGLFDAGVNRLSFGIQTFDDAQLKQLGRIHSSLEAGQAIQAAQRAGFKNINLDLMHGLPNQTPKAALNDLNKALDFQPTHLSWYQLTIEPNTQFYNRPPILPDDELLWELQETGIDFLASRAYERYEVSAYCQNNQVSRHNLNYWEFGDYLGVGAGAHGKITRSGEIFRTAKSRQPSDYITKMSASTELTLRKIQKIDEENLIIDFFMNVLRLKQGVEKTLFTERTGLPFQIINKKFKYLQEQRLLVDSSERIQSTETGFNFLNTLLQEFLPK